MGRRERPIDVSTGPLAEFAHDLRELRRMAGSPSYREMARRAHYSATTLSTAANGLGLPSQAVMLAFVAACNGNPEQWRRRWEALQAQLSVGEEAGPNDPPIADPGQPATQPVPVEESIDQPISRSFIRRLVLPIRTSIAASGRPVWRRRIVVVSGVGLLAALASGMVAVVMASAPNPAADPDACTPLPVANPEINAYVDRLRTVTMPVCIGLRPAIIGATKSGRQTIGGQSVTYYVQRNPDGYVQSQLDGQEGAAGPEWSVYWQENPPDNPAHPNCSWYQQKVTDTVRPLTWRTTGWLCPVAPNGSDSPTSRRPPDPQSCDPLPAPDRQIDDYVDQLRSATQAICMALPVRTDRSLAKTGSESTGNVVIDGQQALYLVQRYDNDHVQLQLVGPSIGAGTHPTWGAFWLVDAPDDPGHPGCVRYQERVDTFDHQPAWQASGWICPNE